ncbi:MAG: twin-arginine translocase TatA/TatE family subunit [Proteobacteria bacterium]|nr:twin-arginine translocase TatA/TatE family subunit [Pseudomonadota bacterium]
MFGWLEFAIIAGAILVLFGGSRLPGLARGLGKMTRNYRHSLRGDDGIKVHKVEKNSEETDRF